ncbi:short-chain dehydrogenase/reductase SDR [Rhodopirellula maiorica SM1]|uniref:Short-chain dehydrogenase/reductase SDR n=1 Tax=Rhodopirellula maiorica SM1 TaxID=1265738 RepID=M5S6M0_9BACT|nr:SDR family oxidoreductase [Rhodopirellula maiorica]EMI21824.1 short-chain dehydrogenase/reductase SDR [Rhodopirellula maiorica SM1]
MKKTLKNDVVVITGAAAGVGRAAAVEFAQAGAAVGLLARGKQRLDDAVDEITSLGGRAIAIATDVADAAAVEQAAQQIEDQLGPIDCWVNNAMTTVLAPLEEISADEFRRATEVTYLGTVYGTMVALKHMRPRDRGVIVQVGSALAYRAIPLQAPYCGAKHAIRGFTDSLRSELIHDHSGIHLTMVQMPALNTPQFSWCRTRLPNHPQPVPPIFQPQVAARAIRWAAQHRRREVHVGHSAVMTIWGNKFFSGYGDRYLAKHAYQGQQTDQPIDPNRPDNLFDPVDADFAAQGIFDDRAKSFSYQFWLTRHRITIAAIIIMILVTVGVLTWMLAN